MPSIYLMEAILILFAYNLFVGILSSIILIAPSVEPSDVQYTADSFCNEEVTAEKEETVSSDAAPEEEIQEDESDEEYPEEQEITETEDDIAEETVDEYAESYNMFDSGFDSSFKAYMDYRCITDTTSVQYELQQQAYTDDRGLRRIGDDYCVALGTGITGGCGERFIIYLDSGYSFTVIVSDVKSDYHTDATCCFVPTGDNSGNVVEFIIDTDYADSGMLSSGNVGYYEDLSGNITAIEKIS